MKEIVEIEAKDETLDMPKRPACDGGSIATRVVELRALSRRSPVQMAILDLYDEPTRTSEQGRQLAALLRADFATSRATVAQAKAAKILSRQGERDRKARDRHLIELGRIIERSGMSGHDHATLLGGLRAMSKAASEKFAAWKAAGDAEMAAAGNDEGGS